VESIEQVGPGHDKWGNSVVASQSIGAGYETYL